MSQTILRRLYPVSKLIGSSGSKSSIGLQNGPISIITARSFTATPNIKNSSNISEEQKKKESLEWLSAIRSLKKEFTNSEEGYDPQTALVVPGVRRTPLGAKPPANWEPTEEQLAEVEALKKFPKPVVDDPMVIYLSNFLMKRGKKATAQKRFSRALYHIFVKTRLDPLQYFFDALDSLAPVVKIFSASDGGAKVTTYPKPLDRKGRYRQAWSWIIEESDKRTSRDITVRLAEEIMAVHDGNSQAFKKKSAVHKIAIVNRENIHWIHGYKK